MAVALVGIVVLTTAVLSLVGADGKIVIGSGPVTSAGYEASLRLANGLSERGFDVEVVPSDRTQDLIELLADPNSPVEVTFVTEAVNAAQYPQVNSLGTIDRLLYAFVAWPAAHGMTSLAEAQGMRIDLGPAGSTRVAFAEEALKEFGVTAQNSTFLYLPSSATLDEIRALDVEIQIIDKFEDRSFMAEALATGDLEVIPVPEASSLSERIASAEAVEIPYALFSLVPPVPQEITPSVAQLVTVVALDSLNASAAYAIAQELTTLFSPGTAFTEPGEFPNFADRQLPANPYAAEFYANGSVPWHFANLPPILADYFFGLVFVGTLILLAASVWSIFLPEFYSLWTGVIRPRAEDRYLAAMEEALEQGRELTPRDQSRLEKILSQHAEQDRMQARAERLRPHVE